MLSDIVATVNALARLRRRIPISRARLGASLALLLLGGGLEGATIGLLIPLLSMLTGSEPTGSLQLAVDALMRGIELETKVLLLGMGIVVLVGLKNAVSYAGVATASTVRKHAVIELRRQLLDAVLHAPPTTLERYTSGEITGVLTTEAWRVNRIFDQILSIVHRTIISASYLTAILVLSWRLTLVTMLLGMVLAAVSQWLGRRPLQYGRDLTQANLGLARRITEVVGGYRVIRTTASESAHEVPFDRINREHSEADVGAGLSQSMLLGVVETLGIAGAMGLTALAYVLWLKPGDFDAPSFLAFGFALVRLLPALNQSYAGYGQLMTVVGSLERVMSFLDLPRYPTRPFGNLKVPKLTEGIRFDGVGFRYGEGNDVLRALSFTLPVGETLAVLGASGSGKSTFASLLLRLREPTAGKILLDGTDHWAFAPQDFHQAIALVEQEPFLFNATVAENVACLLPNVDREAVLAALQRVQLGDLIQTLPQGIDTVLAERGATLSGGQRQRLAIARAIVRNPQVLVLDEPTSALDSETEQEVVDAIDAASVGRTTIIITHRPSTVRHATLRLYLDTGRIEKNPTVGAPAEADRKAQIG